MDRDVRMNRAVAGLGDRQRAAHQRFRFAEPIGGLQQCGKVVEGRSRLSDDRSGRKLASSIASARRISGSASPSRLVVFQQLSEVIETGRDTRVVWREVRLGDSECTPVIWFGAWMQRFYMEQRGKTTHHVHGRLGDARRVGVACDCFGVRRQRIQDLPGPDILWITDERRVDPAQSLGQTVPFCPRLCQPAPCYVQDQAVQQKGLGCRIAPGQRVFRQIVQRGVRVVRCRWRRAPARRAAIPAPVRGPGMRDVGAGRGPPGSVDPPRPARFLPRRGGSR